MATYLYNCKHCKIGRRVEYPFGDALTGFYRKDEAGKRINAGIHVAYFGPRPDPRAAVVVDLSNAAGPWFHSFDGDPLGMCACKRSMKYARLSAITNPDVPCNAKCTEARGPQCECSCGGKNHGTGWMSSPGKFREAA